jgi:hypothetical protein
MVDAHLRQCGGSIASGRSGGISGFLQHDAYLWSCGLGETLERLKRVLLSGKGELAFKV